MNVAKKRNKETDGFWAVFIHGNPFDRWIVVFFFLFTFYWNFIRSQHNVNQKWVMPIFRVLTAVRNERNNNNTKYCGQSARKHLWNRNRCNFVLQIVNIFVFGFRFTFAGRKMLLSVRLFNEMMLIDGRTRQGTCELNKSEAVWMPAMMLTLLRPSSNIFTQPNLNILVQCSIEQLCQWFHWNFSENDVFMFLFCTWYIYRKECIEMAEITQAHFMKKIT